jgi:hypothetical protein
MMISLPQSTLESLWEASRKGLITWGSVQAHQADMMPRCVNHPDRSAPVIWNGDALCVTCAVATVSARKETN